MAGFIYQDAYLVWHALEVISNSIKLQRASTLRFELDDQSQAMLALEEKNILTQMRVDQLIIISDIQGVLDKYFNEVKFQDQWTQELKVSGARRKTLELRTRNLDQELSKGGLFRGRKQQPLMLERNRIATQLIQLHSEVSALSNELESLDQQRRALSERISTEDVLRDMHWVAAPQCVSGGLAISLTVEGQFLFDYLSDMSPNVLKGRSLSQVLVYGLAWSIAERSNSLDA